MEKQKITCPDCKGLGAKSTRIDSNIWLTSDCDTCHGTGKIELFCGTPKVSYGNTKTPPNNGA